MNREELKDTHGALLGVITRRRDGRFEGKDHLGKLCGRFDPVTRKTYDRHGNWIGTGNLLAVLILGPRRATPLRGRVAVICFMGRRYVEQQLQGR